MTMIFDPAIAWLAVSAATAMMQLMVGTSLDFAAGTFVVFVLCLPVFRLYRRMDSIGAVLLVATFGKLFIASQWVKIVLGQPGDSHLEAPGGTVLALVLGLCGFLLAGAVLAPVLPRLRLRVMGPDNDPRFLRRLGIAALAASVFGMVARHVFAPELPGGLTAGDMDLDAPIDGPKPFAGWNYLIALWAFAVAAFTARRMVLSNGRGILDGYVAASLIGGLLLGIVDNSRTTMFSGAVACYLTYLVYGGRVRLWHVGVAAAGVLVTQLFIFPLVDMQRGLLRTMPLSDFLSESATIAEEVLSGEYLEGGRGYQAHFDVAGGRLYYGRPSGLIDRFSPSQLDEVVAYVDRNGPLGDEYLLYAFVHLVPRRVLVATGLLDEDYPLSGGALIELEMLGNENPVHLNYGLLSEVCAYSGLELLPLLTALYLVPFLLIFHLVFGGLRRNFVAAFGATVFLFLIADTDSASLLGRLAGQGGMYAVLYLGAARLLATNQQSRSLVASSTGEVEQR